MTKKTDDAAEDAPAPPGGGTVLAPPEIEIEVDVDFDIDLIEGAPTDGDVKRRG